MAERLPIVRVDGKLVQLPAGDNLPLDLLSGQLIDGGSASSVYLIAEVIDGGGASG
jgi:hypothetical protein